MNDRLQLMKYNLWFIVDIGETTSRYCFSRWHPQCSRQTVRLPFAKVFQNILK